MLPVTYKVNEIIEGMLMMYVLAQMCLKVYEFYFSLSIDIQMKPHHVRSKRSFRTLVCQANHNAVSFKNDTDKYKITV